MVSLIASSTEIVCALGFRDSLVGRSHECDFPLDVRALPAVTAPKFPVDGTSYEIDQRLRAIVAESLSVYRVDGVALAALAPDVIVTQTQCEVCAVSLRDVEDALCQVVGSRPRIVALEPNGLPDIWRDIRRVADVLGAPERGIDLVAGLEERMVDIGASLAGAPRVRLASIEWIDPLMAAGNWHPTLVETAGGVNLFGEAGRHSPWMSWDDLRAADPEAILVAPCGFDIPRARAEMGPLVAQPGWRELAAVRNGRVYLGDGNQYFNRPGPRVVESLEILAEILHPERFPARHEGSGWVRFTM